MVAKASMEKTFGIKALRVLIENTDVPAQYLHLS